MKAIAAALASLLPIAATAVHAQTKIAPGGKPMFSTEDVRMVAPALQRYTHDRLLGEVWKRPGLSLRDRSIVTLAALIARNQAVEMPYYVNLALDNGVKPAEVSEIITHLAFYSGWANAIVGCRSGEGRVREPRHRRRPAAGRLPKLLPLDEAAEAASRIAVGEQFGTVSPGVVAVHDGRPVPRSVAAPGARAARPQPRHRQRARRYRPGRADYLPSEPRDG